MSANELHIQNLSRSFGAVKALDDFSLELGVGELVALLGPSGCGKTTALRIVAGLEKADAGRVILGSTDISTKPAHERNMGMVFQAYSLFPNLTVEENVAFGLQMRKVAKGLRLRKASELLELVGLNHHHKRYPHQLSGGQQQRVALARALAYEPDVLLLDEPLSALDAQVRTNLREEIRRLQLSLGTTTLFVTHDQEEAMAISDRVGVMNAGKLEQIATPDTLYNQPISPFVASFVGAMNKVKAKIEDQQFTFFNQKVMADNPQNLSGFVTALIRPESFQVKTNSADSNARVLLRSFQGANSIVVCQTNDGQIIQASMPSTTSNDLHPGVEVELIISASKALVTHG